MTIRAEALANLQAAKARLRKLWQPPPTLTVSEWAEKNRILPPGTSVRPGPWKTESFQREIMDCILDPDVREIDYMKSTQVGYSETLNNIIGYFIDANPRPMMMVQPIEQSAKEYSQKRIDPMLEACECLRGKVRETGNSNKHGSQKLKQFDGGFIKIVGANSAPGLRSDYVPVILFDEIEGYPDDVKGEGDPIDIATRRSDTDPEAKIFKGSTPAKPKGFSRIEAAYEKSSQARYFVPCPSCGCFQALAWRGVFYLVGDSYEFAEGDHNLKYEVNDTGDVIEESVKYICASCEEPIAEQNKRRMLDLGRWVHKYPERRHVRGFHINALYSPWKPVWSSMATEWRDAKDNPEKLKTFVNLRLGETWNEGANNFNAHTLAARKHEYEYADAAKLQLIVPEGVGVLVAAADVQHNRIEAQIIGFGKGEESWLIAHEIFYGDPALQSEDPDTGGEVWQQLDDFLLKQWQHKNGLLMRPAITLVDSGDNSDAVYKFVMPRQNMARRVFACKGVDYLAKPVLVQEGVAKKNTIRLWSIHTYMTKDRIFARMKLKAPGPGYMHFPEWTTDEYLAQMTGEKKIPVTVRRTRVTKHIYVKTHRNEALDMTVYCHAGLVVLQKHIDRATYGDLDKLVEAVQKGGLPQVQRRTRSIRSHGITS
jgi:phage terminase large subunit GpA-like protein